MFLDRNRLLWQIRGWLFALGSLSLIGAGPAPRSFSTPRFFEPIDPPRSVQIMAHRGMAEQTPENTSVALEHCISDGIEWAEIDLRQTRDGVHVLFHDSRIERTTNGEGELRETDLATVQKLDAGSWFAKRFASSKVLTFHEALQLAKGRLNLCLDCKAIDAEVLVREIRTAGMEKQVVVYGSEELLKKIHEIAPNDISLMPKWRSNDGLEAWIDRAHPSAVEVDANDITMEGCRAFHQRGIKVQAKALGEFDRPEIWSKMIADGVDWIQTERPIEVLALEVRLRNPKFPVEFALHRAASRYAPENTIAAIDRAIRLGCDYVEIDIRTSRDGKFFLQHDATFNSRTTGRGPVREMDSALIQKLDAGSWFGRPFVGEPVPQLEQALDRLKGRANVYFDAKDIAPESLAAILRSRGLFDEVVVYQSVDYLKKLRAIEPRARLMPSLKNVDDIERLAELIHPYAFDTKWSILSKDLVNRCHAKGVKVFSDALGFHENVAEFRKAIGFGIDLIQTDQPARFFRAIELIGDSRDVRGRP